MPFWTEDLAPPEERHIVTDHPLIQDTPPHITSKQKCMPISLLNADENPHANPDEQERSKAYEPEISAPDARQDSRNL